MPRSECVSERVAPREASSLRLQRSAPLVRPSAAELQAAVRASNFDFQPPCGACVGTDGASDASDDDALLVGGARKPEEYVQVTTSFYLRDLDEKGEVHKDTERMKYRKGPDKGNTREHILDGDGYVYVLTRTIVPSTVPARAVRDVSVSDPTKPQAERTIYWSKAAAATLPPGRYWPTRSSSACSRRTA